MIHAEKRLGYRPDYHNPRTFNEKVTWRKLFDRNPLFPIVSDKIAVRDEIRRRLGDADARRVSTELYTVTDRADRPTLADLPPSFAAKASHASGWNIFVSPQHPVDEPELRAQMRSWLRRSYGKTKFEWAYQPVPRRVMFEELLQTADGRAPDDMKFMFFDGTCHFVLWDDDRFGDWAQHYLAPDWTPHPFHSLDLTRRDIPPKPAMYGEMLAIAQRVAQGFDNIRVDFLFTEDRIVLNELTLYRGSGMNPFHPPEWDRVFGELWTLDRSHARD